MNTIYTSIIGMEIHVELSTQSKMFCGCKNDPFHAPEPNIHTCPTCLGLPGGLPVPNKKAIEWTIKLGLALNCRISGLSHFDRKNYFYPDLAKGYQISQYDHPFATNGVMHYQTENDNGHLEEKSVRIRRVHLEEDTAKLMHGQVEGKGATLIDFNRSGVPLVEIVTEPDIRSGKDAKQFLKKLQQIIRFLKISEAQMEKGSMRLEPNISVKKSQNSNHNVQSQMKPEELPPYKVEVKNINSYNFVKKAIDFEVGRQTQILKSGKTPKQETRGFIESTSSTVSQRSKEEALDYRYFPEPDIPPIRTKKQKVLQLKKELPELPDSIRDSLIKNYALSFQDAETCCQTEERVTYLQTLIDLFEANQAFQELTVQGIVKALINRDKSDALPPPRDFLTELKKRIADKTVSETVMKEAIKNVVKEKNAAVADYKSGKTTALMFLLGQVKKELKGKGDAEIIKKILLKQIARN